MNLINIIDDGIYNCIEKLMTTDMTIFMTIISHFGSAITLITLTVALIIFFKNKKYTKLITLNLVLSFIINKLLKFIIARPRPPQVISIVRETRI